MQNMLSKKLFGLLITMVAGISGNAFAAWSIEGKVDIVDIRSAAPHYIYIAPKDTVPSYRWRVTNVLEYCNYLAAGAVGNNDTVIFQGTGTCDTAGPIRVCSGQVDRCVIYRNR